MIELSTELTIYLSVIAFLLGACVGSFVDCAADRYVCKQSVLKGRSHCASCGHVLGILDLFPIFSWLFRRGKCHYCGAKIPVSCLVTELVGALGYTAVFLRFGLGFLTLELFLLAPVLLAIALIDIKTMEIPNGLVIATVVLFALSIPAHYDNMLHYFLDGLIGSAVYGGGILLISLVMDKIMKRETMGGGDIKLFFAVGLFLGLLRGLLMIILACLIGIVTFFVNRRAPRASAEETSDENLAPSPEEKAETEISQESEETPVEAGTEDEEIVPPEKPRSKEFPFGPAICLATFICMIVGTDVVNLYLSLFV